MYYTKTQSNT